MFKRHSENGRLRRLFNGPANELRRAADRKRRRCRIAFACFLFVAVFCAIAVAFTVWNSGARAAQAQALHRHRVSATTVGAANHAQTAGAARQREAWTKAVWEYPASHPHSDRVLVPADTPVGGKVAIWVDDTGVQASAPPSDSERLCIAAVVGLAVFGVLFFSAGGVVWLRLHRVEERSLAEWDRGWEAVEPRWSGRTHPGADAHGD